MARKGRARISFTPPPFGSPQPTGLDIGDDGGPDGVEGESAYALREHGRPASPPIASMTDQELAELRERLVLDATARVLEAVARNGERA